LRQNAEDGENQVERPLRLRGINEKPRSTLDETGPHSIKSIDHFGPGLDPGFDSVVADGYCEATEESDEAEAFRNVRHGTSLLVIQSMPQPSHHIATATANVPPAPVRRH
jgi:hypothetical protein